MSTHTTSKPASPVPLIVALALSAAFATGCDAGDDDAPAPPPVEVGVWTVDRETLDVTRDWVGRVEPLLTPAVQAPRGGRLTEVLVRDGERVGAGDLLARMEGPDLDARREALQARSRQLEEELARWERLAAQGAAGAGEVAQARLQMLQAREALGELEALAGSYLIRAPASGRVHGIMVSVGTQVSTGETLMRVDDDGSWGVRLSVPAWEAALFEEGDRLTARDADGTERSIARISSSSELQPGFVAISLFLSEVTGPRGAATLTYRSQDEVLLVPWTAVAGEDDAHWVARVVEGDPATVERRAVELGRPFAGGVEVLSGLDPGDRVIRYEPRSHPEGRAVTPVESRR